MTIEKSNTYYFFLLFILFLSTSVHSQYLVEGKVVDEYNRPLPKVEVYVKYGEESPHQTDENGHFQFYFQPGEIYLILSLKGYEKKEVFVPVLRQDQTLNIQMIPAFTGELDDIIIKAKKVNIGREIIQKVVRHKDTISQWNYSHNVSVYIKTKDINALSKASNESNNTDDLSENPFSSQSQSLDTNLLEIKIVKDFEPIDKIKERKIAYSLTGNNRDMYYQNTAESEFNFFQNTLPLPKLHQTPILSPISTPGILGYKYRLESKYQEDSLTIYKIKITARTGSTSTLSGYIYIVDSLFIIQKLDLELKKGNLFKYDYFKINQEYGYNSLGINYLKNETFDYGIKTRKEQRVIKTSVYFDNYKFNTSYNKRYFNNEVSQTTLDAYKKDSSYWKKNRPIALTIDELQLIERNDSIKKAHNKKEYLDSVDKEFNRITVLKVLWYGIDLRNRKKKEQWSINPAVVTLRPIYIAGPRLAPGFNFFKKWDNERYIDTYSELSYGFLNKDVKGRGAIRYNYDPFKAAIVEVGFSHDFDAIRSYDAITQIYKRSNFIEATQLNFGHNYEWFNGLYSSLTLNFSERRPLNNYQFINWLDKPLNNDLPSDFYTYQAAIASLQISYTPFQKYIREPYRKVVLGTKWPTIYGYYERGIPKVFGSDVDFDYLQFGIKQQISIGSIGNLSYHVKSGEFLSSKSLMDADKKYLRRSDPIWFSNPMYSFQKLDTLIPTIKRIVEAHLLYHDNGAIINKIPFAKKARIGLVVGAGFAYLFENNWWHSEILVGLERNFRLSRRLLRLGVYYAVSKGKSLHLNQAVKFSFSILDNRTMKFNF